MGTVWRLIPHHQLRVRAGAATDAELRDRGRKVCRRCDFLHDGLTSRLLAGPVSGGGALECLASVIRDGILTPTREPWAVVDATS